MTKALWEKREMEERMGEGWDIGAGDRLHVLVSFDPWHLTVC